MICDVKERHEKISVVDFYRIRGSGLENFDPDPDPGDPKRLDPDPPYTIFNKPYYVRNVFTSF